MEQPKNPPGGRPIFWARGPNLQKNGDRFPGPILITTLLRGRDFGPGKRSPFFSTPRPGNPKPVDPPVHFWAAPASPSGASGLASSAPGHCPAEAVFHVDAAISAAISGNSGGSPGAQPLFVFSQKLPPAGRWLVLG